MSNPKTPKWPPGVVAPSTPKPIGPGKGLIDMGFKAAKPRSELQRMLAAQGYTAAADLLPPFGCTIEEATALIAAALDDKQRADVIAATKQRCDRICGYDREWLLGLHRLGVLHRVERMPLGPRQRIAVRRSELLGWCGRITLIGQLVGMLLVAE